MDTNEHLSVSDVEKVSPAPVMRVRQALVIYAGCLLGFGLLLILKLQISWVSSWVPIGGYLVAGYILNRTVLLRLIEWHPVYNTIQNVSSAKLRQLLLWPFTYLDLFIRLAINKYL